MLHDILAAVRSTAQPLIHIPCQKTLQEVLCMAAQKCCSNNKNILRQHFLVEKASYFLVIHEPGSTLMPTSTACLQQYIGSVWSTFVLSQHESCKGCACTSAVVFSPCSSDVETEQLLTAGTRCLWASTTAAMNFYDSTFLMTSVSAKTLTGIL